MEEKLDVLDRSNFINNLENLVRIISETGRGCCFGLNGSWGSGKSFVLDKFEKEMKEIQSGQTNDDKYFVFHYDCWEYDYYEEPIVAIIAAMLDAANKELHILSSDQRDILKRAAWEAVEKSLKRVAEKLCKNKIGMNLVEIAVNMLEGSIKESGNNFDPLYGFKRALEETRDEIQEIASRKTMIIVVDELDRCLPAYTIKVLERLHHVFTGLKNVIVIVSMDKKQIEHSIKQIYGQIDVDTYLRKIISFKVNLDKGKAAQYIEKYETYTSMFEIPEEEKQIIETFFADIMSGLDIRTQERIFNKAETIHRLIQNEEIKDDSIMAFEILFLTISIRAKNKSMKWLIDNSHYVNTVQEELGIKYCNMLKEYEKCIRDTGQAINGNVCIRDDVISKTFFWIANLYGKYQDGACEPYYYKKQAEKRVKFVRKFKEIIDNIDYD